MMGDEEDEPKTPEHFNQNQTRYANNFGAVQQPP